MNELVCAIERLSEGEARKFREPLMELLQACVRDGASIGFIWPLPEADAVAFWEDIFRDVGKQSRILLVALHEGRLVGTVQLGLCMRANGLHRAEVQKLMVHPDSRRLGTAKLLMSAAEKIAGECGRSLLYLDTEPGKPAVKLYETTGWVRAGEIPRYASTPDGRLHGTAIFYKLL